MCSFHNVDFREVVKEHDLTRDKPFLVSGILVLGDRPCGLPCGHKDTSYQYDVLAFEDIADAVALCKQVMRPRAHGDMSCSA